MYPTSQWMFQPQKLVARLLPPVLICHPHHAPSSSPYRESHNGACPVSAFIRHVTLICSIRSRFLEADGSEEH